MAALEQHGSAAHTFTHFTLSLTPFTQDGAAGGVHLVAWGSGCEGIAKRPNRRGRRPNRRNSGATSAATAATGARPRRLRAAVNRSPHGLPNRRPMGAVPRSDQGRNGGSTAACSSCSSCCTYAGGFRAWHGVPRSHPAAGAPVQPSSWRLLQPGSWRLRCGRRTGGCSLRPCRRCSRARRCGVRHSRPAGERQALGSLPTRFLLFSRCRPTHFLP